jgi:hypothetical protein
VKRRENEKEKEKEKEKEIDSGDSFACFPVRLRITEVGRTLIVFMKTGMGLEERLYSSQMVSFSGYEVQRAQNVHQSLLSRVAVGFWRLRGDVFADPYSGLKEILDRIVFVTGLRSRGIPFIIHPTMGLSISPCR